MDKKSSSDFLNIFRYNMLRDNLEFGTEKNIYFNFIIVVFSYISIWSSLFFKKITKVIKKVTSRVKCITENSQSLKRRYQTTQ